LTVTGTVGATTGVGPDDDVLLGIGEAAARAGVSERALRYYQQLGLLTPSGRTPGGMRRYSAADLARVARIRELQSVLGFNLDEIRLFLDDEDRLDVIRQEYLAEGTAPHRRRELAEQGLVLRLEMRATVDAKVAQLLRLKADLDATIGRLQEIVACPDPQPAPAGPTGAPAR